MLSNGVNPSLHVVKAQMQLRHLNFYKGPIDGNFSDDMTGAVKAFQLSTSIAVDGIIGPYTSQHLAANTKEDWFVLFIHCSASPEGRAHTAEQVVAFHTLPVSKGGRGWSRPGYSDVVELDGKLVNIRDWNADDKIDQDEYTFGVKFDTMLNRNARHVCYIGGVTATDFNKAKDTRTEEQSKTLETYTKFALLRNPNLIIAGHNQVQPKPCPSFDVPTWLKSIGVAEYNIANWGELYK